jgi:hypothetical protein
MYEIRVKGQGAMPPQGVDECHEVGQSAAQYSRRHRETALHRRPNPEYRTQTGSRRVAETFPSQTEFRMSLHGARDRQD